MTDIGNFIVQLYVWFISDSIQQELLPAKLVFIFFSFAFVAILIYFMFESSYLYYHVFRDISAFFVRRTPGGQRIYTKWKEIEKKVEGNNEYDYKVAVIEADDLLREILEEKGFAGKTLEERVTKANKAQLPNKDEILEVHGTRNEVVYDPNFKLTKDQATKILKIYESGIKNIADF